MPVNQTSVNGSGRGVRVAGLILRRNPEREFHTYLPLLPYQPSDYQILLRTWPSEPFKGYLGTFSGPLIAGKEPSMTLKQETVNWTGRLAQKAQLGDDAPRVSVRRAEFISVHGGGGSENQVDPLTGKEIDMGLTLCYVLPTTTRESSVVARYPTDSEYPQFYDLSAVLQGMMTSPQTVKVHPMTREMLSSLDKWLRERHALAGSINYLFSPSLESRLKMSVTNPLHAPPPVAASNREEVGEDGSKTADVIVTGKGVWPISSSTPFQRPLGDSLHRTTVAEMSEPLMKLDQQPVDVIIKNPLFGSGVDYNQVDTMVANRYFGMGIPDYDSLGEKRGKWSVKVEGDGMPDWIDLFPMHKCACEGDVEGVRRCMKIGVSPDEKDTDSWTALHYACWYGEIDVVKALVGEASADLGAINNTGSTPLHLAAAMGHSEVVRYLLQQPGIILVQAAIDCEGKSPLAVCLECRVNEWSKAVKLLREAYATAATQQSLSFTPSLLSSPGNHSLTPDDTHSPSPHPTPVSIDDAASLGGRGSLASRAAGKTESSRKKSEKLVRRQRVDIVNGQHVLAHFTNGKGTTTKHVLQDIYKLIRLAPQYHDMVALWIQSESLEIQLGDGDKPLQLMSKWPSLLTQHVAKATVAEIPKLCLRRNVFISQSKEKLITDQVILELLYADAKKNVLSGRYLCSEEEAIELGGITMQVLHGDHVSTVHHSGFLHDQLDEVLPVAMAKSRRKVEFERRVLTQHSRVSQNAVLSESDPQASLYKQYLQKCWQWPFYGAAFFPGSLATKSCQLPTQAKMSRKAHIPINIAINTVGFHLISTEMNSLITSLSFDSVEWDASAEKHRVLLSRSDRTLHVEIQTRMAGLFFSLVSRMTDQYLQRSHGNTSTNETLETQ